MVRRRTYLYEATGQAKRFQFGFDVIENNRIDIIERVKKEDNQEN